MGYEATVNQDEAVADEYEPGGTVYFATISVEQKQYMKVGYTAGTAKSRLAALATSSPFDFALMCAFPGDREDEKRVHRLLVAHRAKREWFHLTEEVDDFLEDLVEAEIVLRLHADNECPNLSTCLDWIEARARPA